MDCSLAVSSVCGILKADIGREAAPGRCSLHLDGLFSQPPALCRDITLPTKVHLVKAMVFPVVVCRCVLPIPEEGATSSFTKDHRGVWGHLKVAISFLYSVLLLPIY